MTDTAVIKAVRKLPDESIYDEAGRLAQPDEVWNYGRGDGVEKALLLANVLSGAWPHLWGSYGNRCETRFRHSSWAMMEIRPIASVATKHLRPQTWDCSM